MKSWLSAGCCFVVAMRATMPPPRPAGETHAPPQSALLSEPSLGRRCETSASEQEAVTDSTASFIEDSPQASHAPHPVGLQTLDSPANATSRRAPEPGLDTGVTPPPHPVGLQTLDSIPASRIRAAPRTVMQTAPQI